jgi:hypothetical protein
MKSRRNSFLKKNNNKTLKRRVQTDCNKFCRSVYSPEMEKRFKRIANDFKLPYNPTNEDRRLRVVGCKKRYCNQGCKGYKFKYRSTNSFLRNAGAKITKRLRSLGAISYCEKDSVYNKSHK